MSRASTRWATSVLLASIVVVPATNAVAQQVLRGNVVDRATDRPIPEAEVQVVGLGKIARTNNAGDFVVVNPPTGDATIIVRHLGYRAFEWRGSLPATDTVTVDFALEALPQELAALEVRERGAAQVPIEMSLFEQHRAGGLGTFIVEEVLRAREHSALEDVLRLSPGIRFVRLPRGGTAVASMIPPSPTLQQFIRRWVDGGPYPSACYFQVLVNGIRTWTWGQAPPLDINSFDVRSLQGVEVFRLEGQTPTEYGGMGSTCGTIALWTRTR